jgi:membrane protease YdiL (CAAX protease family)
MGIVLLFHFITNACEELAFRGFAFLCLLRLIGHWPAQLVIAALFALFHIACGWPWHIALFSTTSGSLLFGLLFLRWKSLPMAIGLHAAWNWTRDLVLS